jgi:hypothetical protein
MLWLGGEKLARPAAGQPLPLVLFDHPCPFRQAAFQALERSALPWRLSLTTPSLPGIWGARTGLGVSVRTAHRLPAGVRDVGAEFGLPKLPPIELKMLVASELSPAAEELRETLDEVVRGRILVQQWRPRRR